MITGSVTLNGIGDNEFAEIIKVKLKFEGVLQFAPNQMQPIALPGQPGQQAKQGYNNAVLTWQNERGLKAAIEILTVIEEHQSRRLQAAA